MDEVPFEDQETGRHRHLTSPSGLAVWWPRVIAIMVIVYATFTYPIAVSFQKGRYLARNYADHEGAAEYAMTMAFGHTLVYLLLPVAIFLGSVHTRSKEARAGLWASFFLLWISSAFTSATARAQLVGVLPVDMIGGALFGYGCWAAVLLGAIGIRRWFARRSGLI